MSTLGKQLERVIQEPGTKADRARALFTLGCDRTDVVELLDMSYSQAHSIWKALQSGNGRRPKEAPAKADHYKHLKLSPTQVRYITQDGHEIVRIDKDKGPVCFHCEGDLTFSLKYLGFVHSRSHAEPTEMEDRYSA